MLEERTKLDLSARPAAEHRELPNLPPEDFNRYARYTRKNRHHPNNPYSFTNCLTDTIHKIVSMRSVRRYVTTTSELSGNEKASQNFGF